MREGSPQCGGSILCSLYATLLVLPMTFSTSLFAKAIACEGRLQDSDPWGQEDHSLAESNFLSTSLTMLTT